ncbi:hypothetical protein A2955_05255 [Candidatus Woesebacteria bacterium RIFCSPLOWO2_01_FULL_37_19]|uniref:Uncharacterized protein n=2 Tax=Candidatus Woeseibacteriota TaxID=1752722 RepID=A0A1F8AZ01_9BACT|nr:MAG: hypothetical protein A2771_01385 [Candidatus Woesebacteria bacterium RIFCSPHIGHO2_01_FULL_38_26b]OGM56993.1 MAG: hypothetical protein A2955_05255 [Candidatus Woesebacteria bacterium RIFCSPLOWO2_01_FULL_37_19]
MYQITKSSPGWKVFELFTLRFDLSKYVGSRVLASGNYNSKIHTLVITDVLDLEVLPTKAVQFVTNTPIQLPTEIPAMTPTISSVQ